MQTPRLSALLLALFAVLALGACAAPGPDVAAFGPKRVTVDPEFHEHEVHFLAGSAEPAPGEGERFRAWLRALAPERGDEIVVSPSRGMDPALSAARRDYLQRLAANPGEGPAASTAQPLSRAGDAVKVLMVRHVVRVPDCPDWSRGGLMDWQNLPTSNFGCATATNLRAMVADPRDLVVGRGSESYDGERAALTIQRYREGPQDEEPVASPFGILE